MVVLGVVTFSSSNGMASRLILDPIGEFGVPDFMRTSILNRLASIWSGAFLALLAGGLGTCS